MEKKIPIWVLLLVILIGINCTILFGASVRYVLKGGSRLGDLGPVILTIAKYPSLVKKVFPELMGVSPLLIDNRFPEIDGFKKNGVVQNGAVEDDGYLLFVSLR